MASPAELVERQVCHVLVADGLLSIETQSLKAMAEEILKHWPRRKHLVEDIAFLMRSDTGTSSRDAKTILTLVDQGGCQGRFGMIQVY